MFRSRTDKIPALSTTRFEKASPNGKHTYGMYVACLHYLIKQRGVAEVVRIIESSVSQEYCVTCWECFLPQDSPRSDMFSFPRKVLKQ